MIHIPYSLNIIFEYFTSLRLSNCNRPHENSINDKMIINIPKINDAMRENFLMAGKFSILGLGNGKKNCFSLGRKPTFK